MTDNPPLHHAFIKEMQTLLGESEASELIHAIQNEPAPVSIRLNPLKGVSPLVSRSLPMSEYYHSAYERVPWNPRYGIYLPQRPLFTADPLFHGAAYYVQEASSMALALIKPIMGLEPVMALDLCAAPGGKSTHLSDLLPDGSILLTNEIIPARANILAENMRKWGRENVVCCSTSPKHLADTGVSFDLILADVPCSGEGMFRKDTDSRSEWSPESVAQCADRARGILDEAWRMLRPGGLLVFSTCTYNSLENEENVNYLLDKEDAEVVPLASLSLPPELDILTKQVQGASTPTATLRFMPHRTKGEGLFLALVRKSEDADETSRSLDKAAKKKASAKSETIPATVKLWLKDPDKFEFRTMNDGMLHAIPLKAVALVDTLTKYRIPLLLAGVDIGELKGRNYVPAPALSMSSAYDILAFPRRDLSRDEAIHYLKRETITIPPEAQKGYIVVTYADLPLGFLKHLDNRANNLYPKEWRIRMEL